LHRNAVATIIFWSNLVDRSSVCRRAYMDISDCSAPVRAGRLPLRAEQPPLMLLIVPLRAETRWLIHDQPNAIVFIKDLGRTSEPSLVLFAEYFGLTPAQARLSCELANGRSLTAATAHLGISYATAHAMERRAPGAIAAGDWSLREKSIAREHVAP
jgi:hypothetical protein